MALLSNESQKAISAHTCLPSRSAGYANTKSEILSVEYTDIVLNTEVTTAGGVKKSVSVTHRMSTYILTKPPTNDIITNPKIGDRALVAIVDDANPNVVAGFVEYVYTTTVANDGTPGASSTASWRRIAYAV